MIDNVHRKPLCAYYQKTLGDLEYKKIKSLTRIFIMQICFIIYIIFIMKWSICMYIYVIQQKELHVVNKRNYIASLYNNQKKSKNYKQDRKAPMRETHNKDALCICFAQSLSNGAGSRS